MKPKPFSNPRIFFPLMLILIFLFSFLTYLRFKEFGKSLSHIEPPKFELPKTELFPQQPKVEEKEFTSPDGKLKFKYGSDWREMGGSGGMLDFSQKQVEGAKTLFFAEKLSESVGFLSVQEMEAKPEQKLEDIINKIKGREAATGTTTTSETEIANLNIIATDTEAIFDVDYKKETISLFHSKDKIIKTKNKAYIVSILAFSQNWPAIEPDANKIIDSVQILENGK